MSGLSTNSPRPSKPRAGSRKEKGARSSVWIEHQPSKLGVPSSSLGERVGRVRLSPEVRFRMFVDDRNALGCHHWIGSPRRVVEARRFSLGLSNAPKYTRVVAKCGSPSCVRKEHLAVRGVR